MHRSLAQLPEQAWTPAYQVRAPRAGEHGPVVVPRDGAWLVLRRERPHPGAQLRIPDVDGHRIVGMLTNTPGGQLPDLELRHRRHARVEDRIRNAKDTGMRNLPSTTWPRTGSGWRSPPWPQTCSPGPSASR